MRPGGALVLPSARATTTIELDGNQVDAYAFKVGRVS